MHPYLHIFGHMYLYATHLCMLTGTQVHMFSPPPDPRCGPQWDI